MKNKYRCTFVPQYAGWGGRVIFETDTLRGKFKIAAIQSSKRGNFTQAVYAYKYGICSVERL